MNHCAVSEIRKGCLAVRDRVDGAVYHRSARNISGEGQVRPLRAVRVIFQYRSSSILCLSGNCQVSGHRTPSANEHIPASELWTEPWIETDRSRWGISIWDVEEELRGSCNQILWSEYCWRGDPIKEPEDVFKVPLWYKLKVPPDNWHFQTNTRNSFLIQSGLRYLPKCLGTICHGRRAREASQRRCELASSTKWGR